MIQRPDYPIVLQCPTCGARAGLYTDKTHCSQTTHPPMQPAWASSGRLLTPQECQRHQEELLAKKKPKRKKVGIVQE